jgi:hypothetical protein
MLMGYLRECEVSPKPFVDESRPRLEATNFARWTIAGVREFSGASFVGSAS